ncbi:hypothetical protein Tco_0653765 [Tanacetum coccineum]|uniref:Uncharacterized protein n=1 Tax=Tanacetum coccineum TaxID=301880 RepID=A0ABQ4X297_9ASTR
MEGTEVQFNKVQYGARVFNDLSLKKKEGIKLTYVQPYPTSSSELNKDDSGKSQLYAEFEHSVKSKEKNHSR